MEPLHFGDTRKPLFGMRHRAESGTRRTAVLICPAWGMEYMRSYRGLRLLAQRLAQNGYETLRFDYSGTGDSEGQSLDARLEHWLADINTAAQELRDLTGSEQIAVVGLRLGALLVEAARLRTGLKPALQISWDAPASGQEYVALMHELSAADDALKASRRNRDKQLPPHDSNELHAHAWPAELNEAVTALPGICAAPRQLWLSSSDHNTPAPEGVTVLAAGEASHWQAAAWTFTPWLPTQTIQRIVEQIKLVLP